jgi:hypothetical protein
MIMKTYFSIQMDGWTTNIYWLWMLYIQKLKSLDYQQHTNVIIGSIHRYLNNCLQLVFINDNHWILIKIHVFAPSLHYTTYNSNTLMIRRLPNDTIQLLTSIINVENLLSTYANVMQQTNDSCCGISTITYVANI